MDDYDDNIFDNDDALDYIMQEDVEQRSQQPPNQAGCLGLVAVLLLPVSYIYWILSPFSN